MEARRTHKQQRRRSRNRGFTMLQLVIVLAVGMILSAAAVISIRAGRPGIQLANSAQQLGMHLERARADSVRRRAGTGEESTVEILNATTYRVTMGWGGSGTLTSRDFSLEGDVVISTDPEVIAFNWRGRPVSGTETTVALRNSTGRCTEDPIPADCVTQVDVTGSGDVTVGSEIFQDEAIPEIALNNPDVTGDVSPAPAPVNPHATATPTPIGEDPQASPTPVDGGSDPQPSPTATPKGGNPHASPTPVTDGSPTPTATPRGNPHSTPTPTPTPTPEQTQPSCAPTVSPSVVSISKNGGSATILVSIASGGGTVSVSAPENFRLSDTTVIVPTGSKGAFTITSKDTTRGTFTVTVSNSCGEAKISVTVIN